MSGSSALRFVFARKTAADILSHWEDLDAPLAERYPNAAALLNEAREDVLAFRHFLQTHWRKQVLKYKPAGAG